MTQTVRVGFYGTGAFANKEHLPNLSKLPGVEIVALCDLNREALAATGKRFGVSSLYTDYHEMLEKERIDALFSIVRAYQRTDCEIIAAKKGIHLFIEKPQAADMAKAKEIARAIRESGAIATVGVRERFRPTVEAARKFMAGKDFVHAQKLSFGEATSSPAKYSLEQMGGPFLDWGTHFIDEIRYITGHEVVLAQAFFVPDPRAESGEYLPLSYIGNFVFDNGATANWTISNCLDPAITAPYLDFPHLLIAYRGGSLELRYETLKANGEIIVQTEPTNPWFLSVKAFIEAVRTGDRSLLRNDFSDGLFSLAPVLAARESAKRGGEVIVVRDFAGL